MMTINLWGLYQGKPLRIYNIYPEKLDFSDIEAHYARAKTDS
jgi:hypothetical protein